MKGFVVGGTSSYVDPGVLALDSTKTDGSGKTGIAFNAAGLTCYYKRSNGSASVSCAINTITTLGTYNGSATNAAWKEADATNAPGVYELHLPNNALVAGATSVVFVIRGAAGMSDIRLEYAITVIDLRATALPVTSNYKKNVAIAAYPFIMTASGALATGKAVTVQRSIDAGAMGAGTIGAVTEIGGGLYTVALGAGDVNGNFIAYQMTAAGCDTRFPIIATQP